MTEVILALNAGSTSLKFSLFAITRDTDSLSLLYRGGVEGINGETRFLVHNAMGQRQEDEQLLAKAAISHEEALHVLLEWIECHEAGLRLISVGHRVVHGGTLYSAPMLVDAAVLTSLEQLVPLAPLHQPHNLAAIRAIARIRPHIPQVACFDTAFHHTQPAVAQAFALPRDVTALGVKRYGFHGLSYEYIAHTLPSIAPGLANGKVIAAHLGSGASLCALSNGRSIDSTMGFSALDGLPMGTRPGQIDPGVILHLIIEKGMDPAKLQNFLYKECGLKGLSGISNDMRVLETSDDPRAAFAIEYFAHRIGLHAGMLAAALGGLDAFVFTAGIGENSAALRARVAEKLSWLGAALDPGANEAHKTLISKEHSRVALYVVPTDEELMIARHTLALLSSGAAKH